MRLRVDRWLPSNLQAGTRAMIFIDGENLVFRYQDLLRERATEGVDHVSAVADVYVWSRYANINHHAQLEVVRRYYYTAVQGDTLRVDAISDELKDIGIEAPRVFQKPKGRRSKRVDLSLATDMLTHAHRKNYDIAILVGGDDDYVPLVDAIVAEGRRVILWALDSGLSETLVRRCDYAFDLGSILFTPAGQLSGRYMP